jgi:hypothetical protein
MDFLPDADDLKITELGVKEIIGRIFYFLKN